MKCIHQYLKYYWFQNYLENSLQLLDFTNLDQPNVSEPFLTL